MKNSEKAFDKFVDDTNGAVFLKTTSPYDIAVKAYEHAWQAAIEFAAKVCEEHDKHNYTPASMAGLVRKQGAS